MNIEIRSTRVSDVANLKASLETIWHDTYDSFLGAKRVTKLAQGWHTPEKLAQEASDNCVCSMVADLDGRIVGHVLAYAAVDGRVHIARLYLTHDLHGQGIGKNLLHEALRFFPKAKVAYLEVYEPNERAVRFYKSQGFQVTERLQDAYADAELYEYRMEKKLDL